MNTNTLTGTRAITIRDVARRAGVSESTVSRVLSGAETQIAISEETRQVVLAATREMGYRPHPSARSLSGKNSYLLGLIVREIGDPWFAYLADVISGVAKEKGYDLVLGNARRDPEQALALRDTMLDMRYCEGLLLCGDLQESAEDYSFIQRMAENRRLVSVSRGSHELGCDIPYVGVDNRQGAFLVLEYLAGLGHSRIACISSGRVGDLFDRVAAYESFMNERFHGVPGGYVEMDENSFEGGYRASTRLLALDRRPTAVFGADDRLAIGAMCAAQDAGLCVPWDLSVAGFDDMDFSAYTRPALTTVLQSTAEIGRTAVELLVRMIDEPSGWNGGPCPQILAQPRLTVRDSCSGVGKDEA